MANTLYAIGVDIASGFADTGVLFLGSAGVKEKGWPKKVGEDMAKGWWEWAKKTPEPLHLGEDPPPHVRKRWGKGIAALRESRDDRSPRCHPMPADVLERVEQLFGIAMDPTRPIARALTDETDHDLVMRTVARGEEIRWHLRKLDRRVQQKLNLRNSRKTPS